MPTPARADRLAALGIRQPYPQGLTEAILQKAQTVPVPRRYIVTDAGGRGAVPGLYIRVGEQRPGPTGCPVAGPVTLYVAVRPRGSGKLRHVRLGPVAMGLEAARELASETIRQAAAGVDPVVAKAKAREEEARASTLLEYAEGDYQRRHLAGNKTGDVDLQRLRLVLQQKVQGGRTLGSIRLGELTAEQLDDALAARKAEGLKASTLHRNWRSLCACIRAAWKSDLLEELPFKTPPPSLKGQRPIARTRWLGKDDPGEQERFEKALRREDEELQTIIRLLILTGARRSELLGLEESEVSWARSVATLSPERSKSGRTRHIHLNPEAVRLLKSVKVRNLGGAFWPGARTSSGWSCRLNKAWRRIRKRARLVDLHLHDLRHTHAARLRLSGASLEMVAAALGHASVRSAEVYSNISADEIATAVAKVTL